MSKKLRPSRNSVEFLCAFLMFVLFMLPLAQTAAAQEQPAPTPTSDNSKGVKSDEIQPIESDSHTEQLSKKDSSANSTSTFDLMNEITKPPKPRFSTEVDESTGALVYRYDILISPGRNDMVPHLALVYNSSSITNDSLVGAGWSLSIPSIERINRTGTDKMYTENYFSSSLGGELTSTGVGIFAAKNENGGFLKYTLVNNAWIVTDKKGTVYKFGSTVAARQDNPNDSAKAFQWMLEEVRDTNNNYINYEYYKDAGQIYPSRIIYTGNGGNAGVFEVNFERESRPNATVSYNTGFSVRSNYRISGSVKSFV